MTKLNKNVFGQKTKKGFTLAEVLITLGIIGVVAALTMPTLIAKHNDKANIVKLKKQYSILNQAFKLSEVENGEIHGDLNNDDIQNAIDNIISKLSHIKYCKNEAGCFPDTDYKKPNGESWGNFGTDPYSSKVVLKDGTMIVFTDINGIYEDEKVIGLVIVDINGAKGPNVIGNDTFFFWFLSKSGIKPMGWNGDTYSFSAVCKDEGMGCTGWVLANENFEYLKCPEEIGVTLDWDKSLTCTNK